MRYLLLALLVSLFTAPCLAGVVFEIETQDHDYSPPRTERTSIQAEGASLKMESNEGGRGASDTMIYHGDRREMVVVDHERKSYMVIDRQFAENMLGQIKQATGQMQGMLDNLPAEQRAMIEQMSQGRGTQSQAQRRAIPQVQVSNTGKRETVYGYPCVLFVVTRDGRKVRDVWVTDWNRISGGRELAATFDSMSEFFQELTSALPIQAETPIEDNVFATMKQLGGFPVATREYRADGSLESESALRSAEAQSINPAAFAAPQGYRPESMFGGNAGLRRSPRPAGQYGQGGR